MYKIGYMVYKRVISCKNVLMGMLHIEKEPRLFWDFLALKVHKICFNVYV